jgi:hypothetical protein
MDPTLLQSLIATGITKLGADAPTAQSLIRLAVALAQDANKFQGIKGRDRLDLVLKALREVLTTTAINQKIPPEVLKGLREVIDTIIPETITLVVDASRGSFDLKRPSVGCVASLLALFCKSAAAVAVGTPVGAQLAQAADVTQIVASVAAASPAPTETTETRPPATTSIESSQTPGSA